MQCHGNREMLQSPLFWDICWAGRHEEKKLLLRGCGDKDAIAPKAVEIAATVNSHRNNKSCRK